MPSVHPEGGDGLTAAAAAAAMVEEQLEATPIFEDLMSVQLRFLWSAAHRCV